MDFSALKASVINDSAHEERVQVNQRHLIDKILARYAAAFPIYRELLQNANDAGAKEAKIVFRSASSAESVKPAPGTYDPKQPYSTILFQNDGRPFQPADWNRLKKIAEGNPDEQKIGFFGVGFYSLFSICEEPFVISDQECMAFFWKGDQLYTKRAAVPSDQQAQYGKWTTFLLDLRDPQALPDLVEFGQFLACSLTFTRNLEKVSLYADDELLVSVAKTMSPPQPLPCTSHNGRQLTDSARKQLQTTSPNKLFELQAVASSQVIMKAEYLKRTESKNLIWTSPPKFNRVASTLFFRVAQADLKVLVTREFAEQMERTTKKMPPSFTTAQMVYMGLEEYETSKPLVKDFPLFEALLPFPHQGRVFIGFPTAQTTGFAGHVAAHLIPTVERESIDFIDKHLKVWNENMLHMCALLARILYNDELSDIGQKFDRLVANGPMPTAGTIAEKLANPEWTHLERRCIHTMAFFRPQATTPTSLVGHVMAKRFFLTANIPPAVLTSSGVRSCHVARLPVAELLPFIQSTPYISTKMEAEAAEMLKALTKHFPMKSLGISDLVKELTTRPLTIEETVALLRWWLTYMAAQEPAAQLTEDAQQLHRAVMVLCPSSTTATEPTDAATTMPIPTPLRQFRYYLNPKVVHQGLPVPMETLPWDLSRRFTAPELQRMFGMWQELSLTTWCQFITVQHHTDLKTDDAFAERILTMVSRSIGALNGEGQALIFSLLDQVACVPTQLGHRFPREAYFPNVQLFDDLPIVSLKRLPTALHRLLKDLGVRSHVDLQLVFDRLANLNWDFERLIKYLVSVQEQLTDAEMNHLRQTVFVPGQEVVGDATPCKPDQAPKDPSLPSPQRYFKAKQLFVPTEELQALQLPTVIWRSRWRLASEEARFLMALGVQEAPTLVQMIQLAAGAPSQTQRHRALTYLIEHMNTLYQGYYQPAIIKTPFVPCTVWSPGPVEPLAKNDLYARGGQAAEGDPPPVEALYQPHTTLASPAECFADKGARVMGFKVLHPDWQMHSRTLGISAHPPVSTVLARLEQSPPCNGVYARGVFEYLASRQAEFSQAHWHKLKSLAFIPIDRYSSPNHQGSSAEVSAEYKQWQAPAKQWLPPSGCYFASDVVDYKSSLFTFVDFGTTANLFLKACGVQPEPSPVDLAVTILRDPQQFLQACGQNPPEDTVDPSVYGYQQYLQVLRELAFYMPQLTKHPKLVRQMRNRPFLIAVKDKRDGKPSTASAAADLTEVTDSEVMERSQEYRLEYAYNISLIDDAMLQRMFNPWSCPEVSLEPFYENLGSSWIKKQVTEKSQPQGTLQSSARAKRLQRLICERAPMLIEAYQRDRTTKVLRTSQWLVTALAVREVGQIFVQRTFAPTQDVKIEPTTACLYRQTATRTSYSISLSSDGWYLLIAGPDHSMYDVATCLCKLLFTKSQLNDALLLESLLVSSLADLARKGFPVDRVRNLATTITPSVPPPSSLKPPPSPSFHPNTAATPSSSAPPAVHERLPNYQEAMGKSGTSQPPSAPLPDIPPALAPVFHQLTAMFPNCDPQSLEQCLRAEKHDHLARVSNRLLDEHYPRRPPPSTTHTASPLSDSPSSSSGKNASSNPAGPSTSVPPPIPADGSGVLDSVGNRVKNYLNGWYRGYNRLLPPMTSMGGTSTLSPETGSVVAPGGLPSQPSGGEQQPPGSPSPTPPKFRPSSTLAPNHSELLHKSLQSSIRRCVPSTAAFDGPNTTPTPSKPPVPPSDYTGEQHTEYCRAPPSHNLTRFDTTQPTDYVFNSPSAAGLPIGGE
ncbi:hypothetical protein H4R35_004548 [Dimargaris xerosporica]|nr:hypothetical protein H4R35_004548 [Dimargaris xerosporica]